MINFKKIKYKNFLSTGNNWTEIDFQSYNTNLIVGTNGAGKSTMLDALTFALFNKPFRKVNKGQLINTTNERDCVVEIEFVVNNRDYLVRRGIKPNVFDVSKMFFISPDNPAIIAPTIITDEIALVTDIRGVCNEGVTLQTT